LLAQGAHAALKSKQLSDRSNPLHVSRKRSKQKNPTLEKRHSASHVKHKPLKRAQIRTTKKTAIKAASKD